MTQALTPGALIGLVAHDQKKDDLVAWVRQHRGTLGGYDIVATGTTGGRVLEACPELMVRRLKSGPLGGDQQIGALIAEGRIRALIFFIDPLTPMPHDVDVKALMRLAVLYDIPLALNRSTAESVVRDLVHVLPAMPVLSPAAIEPPEETKNG